MLDHTTGEILHGGETDESDLFVSPTLVKVESANDPLMKEEIFGPVLPILAVGDLGECIKMIREIGDTPLAVYAFTDDKGEQKRSEHNVTLWHVPEVILTKRRITSPGEHTFRWRYHQRVSFENFLPPVGRRIHKSWQQNTNAQI